MVDRNQKNFESGLRKQSLGTSAYDDFENWHGVFEMCLNEKKTP